MVEKEGHIPVMFGEVMKYLSPERGGVYLDGTFGGGGHSRGILEAAEGVRLIGLDQDPEARGRAEEFKKRYGERFKFYSMNFGDLEKIEERGFNGILLDLGVSSFQLDTLERGFSFKYEGELDMRMNFEEGRPAWAFLEECGEEELVEAIRNYGEEERWKGVVRAIMNARGSGLLRTGEGLGRVLSPVLGVRKRGGIHPLTKVYQGIRIFINGEMEALKRVLPEGFKRLAVGGVFAVISFHSLEDRMVKQFFREMSGMAITARDNRAKDERPVYAEALERKAVVASEEEIKRNGRSRSAKLRVIRKLREYER